jgi:hypothetical protein
MLVCHRCRCTGSLRPALSTSAICSPADPNSSARAVARGGVTRFTALASSPRRGHTANKGFQALPWSRALRSRVIYLPTAGRLKTVETQRNSNLRRMRIMGQILRDGQPAPKKLAGGRLIFWPNGTTMLASGGFFRSWYADSRVAGNPSRSRYTPTSCSRIMIRC